MTEPPPSLELIADRLREDRPAEARELLGLRLNGAEAPGFADFAAATLFGEVGFTATPEEEPQALAAVLRDPQRAQLDRLAAAILRIALGPKEESPRIEVACLLLEAGEPHWAEQAMWPVWRQSPSGTACRVISGIWSVLGRHLLAIEAGARAAEAEPGIADYHLHHSGLLLHQGEPAAALLAAGRALGLAPGHAESWRQASAAFLALGQTAQAIEASRRAARLSPDQRQFAEEMLISAGAEALSPAEDPRLASGDREAPSFAAPPKGLQRDWPAWARMAAPAPRPPAGGVVSVVVAKLRLMDALMLREARTFFTHSRLGYAWALFEPLTHVFVLMVAISFLGGNRLPIIGDSLPIFYMTGVLPYLFFCHITEKGMDLARSQKVVLSLPTVTLGDVFLSSLLLRAATDGVVFMVSVGVFLALGIGALPVHPLGIVLAYAMLFLLSSGIAAMNMALSTLSTLPEKIWPIVLRACYFLSGIFYHPDAMPSDFREWVLWNPVVHIIEWVRQSFFPLYVSPHLDVTYLVRCTLVALIVGVLSAAAASRRVRLIH